MAIILSVSIAFAATLSAGIFIKTLKHNIGLVCALAAGFFIALSLFDLLPVALSMAPSLEISNQEILLAASLGFAFLLAVDRGFSRIHGRNHSHPRISQSRVGLLSTVEFCSHGFLEGIAIGVSFQLTLGLGVFVAVAVVSHDFCDGVSTLALMLNSGNSLRNSAAMLLVDASAPVLGATATLFFAIQNAFLVYALAFLLGSFLYMGAGTLFPDAYRMSRHSTAFVLFSAGFILIFILSRIVG